MLGLWFCPSISWLGPIVIPFHYGHYHMCVCGYFIKLPCPFLGFINLIKQTLGIGLPNTQPYGCVGKIIIVVMNGYGDEK